MNHKDNKSSPTLVFLFILSFSSGCGTLMNGSQHYLAVNSSPTGATVTIDNQVFFDTPITAVLDKNDHHTVQIELEGYFPYSMKISRNLNGGLVVGELILFAPLLIVDFITGGIYTLSPDQVQANLGKEGASFLNQRDTLYISVVLEPVSNMERIGTLSKRIE